MFLSLLHLRIGPRLAWAFACLMALLLLLGLLTVSRLDDLSQAFTSLVEEQNETHETVADLSAHADDAARKLLVLINLERDQRGLAYTEIDAANRHLDATMRLLEQRLPVGERRVALFRVQQRLKLYRQRFGENVDLIEADRMRDAYQMLGGPTDEALTLLSEAIRGLGSVEQIASLQRADTLRAQIARDRVRVMLLCLGGLGAIGVMGVLVTRSIVPPLSRAERGAQRIADGQYSHRIEVNGQDEVSRVSIAMNTMAAAIGEREQRLLRMAQTDLLTGLPQRACFITDGDALLAGVREGADKSKGAALGIGKGMGMGMAVLLCLDVDRLKAVNSVLGFDAGDAVLIGAADKLATLFDGTACFGRLAGGTFVTLLPISHADEAGRAACQVQEAVAHKLQWQGQTLDLSVSVGMALFPAHAQDTEGLLRRAEQAMFEAKRQRQPMALFNPRLEASRRQHLSLLSDLQDAIAQGQLRQFLQPKISPQDGSLSGAEALVRWEHPLRGWLPPSEFVPFAEETGRIRQITQWMLEQAIKTLAVWHAAGRALPIAVNVSTLDLQDDTLPLRVAGLLRDAGLPAHLLQLELTESGLMASGQDPIQVLHSLHDLGVRLAIDDFGTGQSSLAYLQRLPVDELKIDRSFVDGVDGDARRQDLLASIIKLGHSLGLVVTAEGVENAAELAVLRDGGCDLVQGYLIAKPMPLESFERWREAYAKPVDASPGVPT